MQSQEPALLAPRLEAGLGQAPATPSPALLVTFSNQCHRHRVLLREPPESCSSSSLHSELNCALFI